MCIKLGQRFNVFHLGCSVGYGSMLVTKVGRKNFTLTCSLGITFSFNQQTLTGVCGTHSSFSAAAI